MAWYSVVANAPKVLVSESEIVESAFAITTTITQFTRTVSTLEYEKRGLTDSAKDTYMGTEATAGHNPRAKQLGGGGWTVTTTEVSITDWSEVV